MTIRFRRLSLRAVTVDGIYGADVQFGDGLTVLWADNTKGKSTCMQGMLYALGLERMLSPRREIPLPHAMTSYLNTDDNRRIDVLESRISLEIQNGTGEIITVNRAVKAETDTRLISVDFGPALTSDNATLRRKNFFVLDPGAAKREDGFHYFLEDFLGWQLPQVRTYDSLETKLYLETIFPLFWVEQKFGWSSIPAAIPTYMRIREVQKRAVEFVLDLDVYKLELQRERLAEKISSNAKKWSTVLEELNRFISRSGARVANLSERPLADPIELTNAQIHISHGEKWVDLSSVIRELRSQSLGETDTSVPIVDEKAEEVAATLLKLGREVDELNTHKIHIHNLNQLKFADISSLKNRINTLKNDLEKNKDVEKLQRYSGEIISLNPDHCPTCEQSLSDTLLPQDSLSNIMPIADNIEYIRSQRKMFEKILSREEAESKNRNRKIDEINTRLKELYSQIRLLRSEQVAPGSNPSAVAIEERLRTEAKIRDLETLQAVFDDAINRLEYLQKTYVKLLKEKSKIPNDKLSKNDKEKFTKLTELMRIQAEEFEFSTFPPSELSISADSYRPEKEGFEIGFETSASDAIRLKWAYQLSLLELADQISTNHPGLLIFDEPRQQSSSKVSFENLLRRAAYAKRRKQQVIFSTSEDLQTLLRITQDLDCTKQVHLGYILQKM